MQTLTIPRYLDLERLLILVAEEAAELLPGCRWLILGPRLAAILSPDDAPTFDQLVALLRLLKLREPELEELGRALAANSEHGEAVHVEICVDRLLEFPDWQHPTQVLERPRPDFRQLLEVARARKKSPGGHDLDRFDSVITKLERAVGIEEEARARREQMRRGRQRS